MAYFVKQEDPENKGQFIYVEVEPSKVEVAPEVLEKLVVGHPKYREVLDETKGRKAKIKELREELAKLAGEPEPEDEGNTAVSQNSTNAGQKPAETPAPLDVDQLYAEFAARLERERVAKETAVKTEAEQLASLAEKHGLYGEDAIELLRNAKDPEAAAKRLAKSQYRYDDAIGGAPSKPDKEALLSNVLTNLGLDGD